MVESLNCFNYETKIHGRRCRYRMCGQHGGRGRGFGLGFRRHGVPSREEFVERLEGYRERLEHELANIDELLKRLKDTPTGTASV
jgi:hypothetical protein